MQPEKIWQQQLLNMVWICSDSNCIQESPGTPTHVLKKCSPPLKSYMDAAMSWGSKTYCCNGKGAPIRRAYLSRTLAASLQEVGIYMDLVCIVRPAVDFKIGKWLEPEILQTWGEAYVIIFWHGYHLHIYVHKVAKTLQTFFADMKLEVLDRHQLSPLLFFHPCVESSFQPPVTTTFEPVVQV